MSVVRANVFASKPAPTEGCGVHRICDTQEILFVWADDFAGKPVSLPQRGCGVHRICDTQEIPCGSGLAREEALSGADDPAIFP
ncbi:hypothetical protein PS639_02391 [Pseudomonas fluorescens]|nr:hypothetical protein PS639_02391 [Pseudomonas fluorescens]